MWNKTSIMKAGSNALDTATGKITGYVGSMQEEAIQIFEDKQKQLISSFEECKKNISYLVDLKSLVSTDWASKALDAIKKLSDPGTILEKLLEPMAEELNIALGGINLLNSDTLKERLSYMIDTVMSGIYAESKKSFKLMRHSIENVADSLMSMVIIENIMTLPLGASYNKQYLEVSSRIREGTLNYSGFKTEFSELIKLVENNIASNVFFYKGYLEEARGSVTDVYGENISKQLYKYCEIIGKMYSEEAEFSEIMEEYKEDLFDYTDKSVLKQFGLTLGSGNNSLEKDETQLYKDLVSNAKRFVSELDAVINQTDYFVVLKDFVEAGITDFYEAQSSLTTTTAKENESLKFNVWDFLSGLEVMNYMNFVIIYGSMARVNLMDPIWKVKLIATGNAEGYKEEREKISNYIPDSENLNKEFTNTVETVMMDMANILDAALTRFSFESITQEELEEDLEKSLKKTRKVYSALRFESFNREFADKTLMNTVPVLFNKGLYIAGVAVTQLQMLTIVLNTLIEAEKAMDVLLETLENLFGDLTEGLENLTGSVVESVMGSVKNKFKGTFNKFIEYVPQTVEETHGNASDIETILAEEKRIVKSFNSITKIVEMAKFNAVEKIE